MIVGFLANLAGYEAAMSCIRGVAVKRGIKIVDKLLIPAGAVIISSIIGDKCQEYTEKQIEEVKSAVNDIRNARDTVSDINTSDEFCEEVVSNVFGKVTEYDENGKPIAGVYPIKEEEVDENGGSENA